MTTAQPKWRIRSVTRTQPHYPVTHRDHTTAPSFIVGLCVGIILGVCCAWITFALAHPPTL